MNKSIPLVSVCIPVYNGEEFLSAALQSVIEQDYENFELIISDDQSTDQSMKIVKEYLPKFKCNTKILKHKQAGLAKHLNFCVENASGEYIKFLFQDDLLYPKCISEMVGACMNHKNIGLVFCKRHIICDSENLKKRAADIGALHLHLGIKNGLIRGEEIIKNPRLSEVINPIGEPTNVLIPRLAFLKAGYFDPGFSQLVDINLWMRIILKMDIIFIDKTLTAFRVHEKQLTHSNIKSGLIEAENKQFYSNFLSPTTSILLHPKTIEHYKKIVRGPSRWKKLRHKVKSFYAKLYQESLSKA